MGARNVAEAAADRSWIIQENCVDSRAGQVAEGRVATVGERLADGRVAYLPRRAWARRRGSKRLGAATWEQDKEAKASPM
jgi:hypothetical protein